MYFCCEQKRKLETKGLGCLSDYSISQTSLEEVFLHFSREAGVIEDPEIQMQDIDDASPLPLSASTGILQEPARTNLLEEPEEPARTNLLEEPEVGLQMLLSKRLDG
ncbi:hypothetical protein AK812_SmicGene18720 [Symbiodinium microadriaticum]|uniref:Uncharacterized protein n=1 Tax=Symbiodinium microadriaticum TaxID=2951 RepID=A0A1Q9DUD8_SYMMI|nr:hypothetical protein AK812_SmicGene18720 [Symbiodinium microadriaticum]